MRIASLPMYNLPEMSRANAAFWMAVQQRLAARGLSVADVAFDDSRQPVPDGIGPDVFFTQICGYPLFTCFRDQGRLLGTPCYTMPGCDGPSHSAYFMVRADEDATVLAHMQGRVFGCNGLLSNTGMNLPRLALARIAGRQRFFSRVVMTGGHVASLEHLRAGAIDLCSIDAVTWGFVGRHRPIFAAGFRVLAQTDSSPSLPFVTSARSSDTEATALRETLHQMLTDPATAALRADLGLGGITAPDVSAYERLAAYEREAADLGYPDIV
jgi:ABC-type phosphate/phosphonate transport system substrate-binding protein